MLAINQLPYVADLDDEIDREQAAMGITLAPEQRQAVKTALSYPLCIISGRPGTGKTMLQRIILNFTAAGSPTSISSAVPQPDGQPGGWNKAPAMPQQPHTKRWG